MLYLEPKVVALIITRAFLLMEPIWWFIYFYPDNVPGLIPYGIGMGHHGHTGASPDKGSPCRMYPGGPFKSQPGPVRDFYGPPSGITGMPIRGPLKSRCAAGQIPQ